MPLWRPLQRPGKMIINEMTLSMGVSIIVAVFMMMASLIVCAVSDRPWIGLIMLAAAMIFAILSK